MRSLSKSYFQLSSTYASCSCEAGYNLTCDDYGPKTPTDYCFLKGTKYYKTCKTGQEVCEGLGFKHHSGSPCSADEVIDSYCPRDNNYYSCKIDPAKYCKNHGYSNAGCAKYETVSTDVCSYDSSYKKCIPTCKSRLADAGYTEVNAGLWYKDKTAVVWDDFNVFNLKNPQGYEYKDVWGGNAFANSYSECSTDLKPRLIIGANSGSTLLQKNLDSVQVIIDHVGTSNLESTGLEAGGHWHDVTITEINTKGFERQYDKDTHFMKKDTRIHVRDSLILTGNNEFNREEGDITEENKEILGLFHLELNDDGKVHIKSGSTVFNGVTVYAHKDVNEGSEFVAMPGTRLTLLKCALVTHESKTTVKFQGASASLGALSIWGIEGEDTEERLALTDGADVKLERYLYLKRGQLNIRGESKLIQGDEKIGVYNQARMCIGNGSKICSLNEKHCQSGRAYYRANPGSHETDWKHAGYSDWYKTDNHTYSSNCNNKD